MNSIPDTIDYLKYPLLLVDDDKNLLHSFKDEFGEIFTIFTAENAKEGLEILEKGNIALMLVDQRMPVMTGVDLLKIAREKYPQIIKMLITAYSDIEVVIEAINEGKIYSYISKPWKSQELIDTIKKGIHVYYLTQERDRLYQEKLDAMKKLARANRLNTMMSMSYGLSDRINNYLFSINMFIGQFPETLKVFEAKLTSEEKDKLKALYSPGVRGLNNMIKLSHEIVSMCTPPTYNFQRYESKVIIDIADNVTEELNPEIKNKEIKITNEIEGNPPATYFDRNAIKQVLWHLIQNSIHAIPENKKGVILIQITGPVYKSGKEFLRVIVRDNGIGIPEENIENVFNPFFTTKGTSAGVGLGLTTCQFIVTQHEGEIEVAESKLGKGTTIYVDLPVRTEPPKQTIDYKDILGTFPARNK